MPPHLHSRTAPSRELSPELRAEVESGLRFMYPWCLTPELTVPLMGEELPSVHATRAELIEAPVRAALQKADGESAALDLGCHEGYFAHLLLEWGADRVVGVDVRDVNVRRARLLRDHFGLPADRLEFRHASVYDLDPVEMARFDVVLCLGLIYHLENPIGALRIARALTGTLCVVESQLTRQTEPVRVGWGISGEYGEEKASWTARFESSDEQEHQPLAAYGGVVSLIPNRAALLQAMRAVGFEPEPLTAAEHHNAQYRIGDRLVVVGR